MTVTFKLDPALEEQLRRRAQASGRSTSEVIRAALQRYLAEPDEAAGAPRSAYALGADLFGRHAGPADLSTRRRLGFAAAAAERHADRHARRG